MTVHDAGVVGVAAVDVEAFVEVVVEALVLVVLVAAFVDVVLVVAFAVVALVVAPADGTHYKSMTSEIYLDRYTMANYLRVECVLNNAC